MFRRTCDHHGCQCSLTLSQEGTEKACLWCQSSPHSTSGTFALHSLNKQPNFHRISNKTGEFERLVDACTSTGQHRSKGTTSFPPGFLYLLLPFAETTLSLIHNMPILSRHTDQNLLLRERRLVPTSQQMPLNRLQWNHCKTHKKVHCNEDEGICRHGESFTSHATKEFLKTTRRGEKMKE